MVSEIAAQPLRKLVVLIAFTLALTVAGHASVLGVAGTSPPTPVAPAGPIVISNSGNISTPTFSANYTTSVYRDPNNSWCTNCLDFVYQFTVLSGQGLRRFTASSFAGFNVDVGTNPFGVQDPTLVTRNPGIGDVIGFNFDQFANGIPVGTTTVQLVIDTNARSWAPGFLSAQDGTAGFGFGFQPAGTPVPEPTTLMLLGTGFTGIAALLRRRKAQ